MVATLVGEAAWQANSDAGVRTEQHRLGETAAGGTAVVTAARTTAAMDLVQSGITAPAPRDGASLARPAQGGPPTAVIDARALSAAIGAVVPALPADHRRSLAVVFRALADAMEEE
jgi:hypothetical protein